MSTREPGIGNGPSSLAVLYAPLAPTSGPAKPERHPVLIAKWRLMSESSGSGRVVRKELAGRYPIFGDSNAVEAVRPRAVLGNPALRSGCFLEKGHA